MAYDIDEFVSEKRRYQELKASYDNAPEKGTLFQPSKGKLLERMTKSAKKLEVLEATVTSDKSFIGTAFVTFRHEPTARQIKRQLNPYTFDNIGQLLIDSLCFCDKNTKMLYKGQKVKVRRANEPGDIIWENLGRKGLQKRRVVISLLLLLVLGMAAGVVYGSMVWKIQIRDQKTDTDSTAQLFVLNLLGFIPSLFIITINILLAIVITVLSRYEKYESITDFNIARAIRLTFAMFINTIVISALVYWDELYESDGFIGEMYNVVIANAFFSPLLQLVSPNYLYLKVKRRFEMGRGEHCTLTQQQANLLMQGEEFDLARRNAMIMKTYLLAMFCAPIFPLVWVFTAISLWLELWTTKYMLLRRYCRPDQINNNLDQAIRRAVKIGVVILAITNMVYHYMLNKDTLPAGIFGLVVAMLSMVFPFKFLVKLRKIWRRQKGKQEEETLHERTYEEYQIDFIEDYARENPITSEAAYDEWFKLIENSSSPQEADIAKKLLQDKLGTNFRGSLVQLLGISETPRQPTCGGTTRQPTRGQTVKIPGIETWLAKKISVPAATYTRKSVFGSRFVRGVLRKDANPTQISKGRVGMYTNLHSTSTAGTLALIQLGQMNQKLGVPSNRE